MALLIGELSVPADCEVAFYHRWSYVKISDKLN